MSDDEKILFECYSTADAAEKFTLAQLLTLAKQNYLSEWLKSNLYTAESAKLKAALNDNASDDDLKLILCKIFNISLSELSAEEISNISALVDKNHRRDALMNEHGFDARQTAFVETQAELIRALKRGACVLYLCGGEFQIPCDWNDRTYIGADNAIIDFTHDSDIDLDERNIILDNLQIYLHNPITIKYEKSTRIKIINGTKKSSAGRPTLQEIFEIMRGRGAFESPESFTRRAEDIRGAAVGMVLLKDTNYNYDESKFDIQPQWNFEYMPVLKNYAVNRNFVIKLQPNHAEILYNNERKLQIFADFTYIDGKLTILNLYLETETLGRIAIDNILRVVQTTIDNISSGSAILAAGYGLNIIVDYNDWDD